MPEAFLRRAPGETRLAIWQSNQLSAMQLWRDGDGVQAGAVIDARLRHRLGSRGIAILGTEELLVEPWPAGHAEGAMARLRVTRAAWHEPGRLRLAKAQPAADAPLTAAPAPEDIAAAAGASMQQGWPDPVSAAWDEAFEAATLGRLSIAGGSLCFQPTPAFTAVDVDGAAPDPAEALLALARAIRLWRLGGSVIVDVPAVDRNTRLEAGRRFDAAMAGIPHERTAINGFGTMQVVLPRTGPSILERARFAPEATAAIALLEAARRERRPGALRLTAAPAIARWITDRPALLVDLARHVGRQVDVAEDAVAGTGHVSVFAPQG